MTWVDDLTPSDWCQAKLTYATIYTLLEISPSVSWSQRYTPDGTRLPSVEKLVKTNASIVRGLAKSELRRHWRWMCRDDPDKVIFRYLTQFKNPADSVNAICKGLKFMCTECDIEKLLATPESELIADPSYEACWKSGIRDIVGKDKRGHLLSVQRLNKHHPCNHPKATTTKNSSIAQYSIVLHESMLRLLPDDLTGASHIIDMTGYTRENSDIKMSKFVVRHMRNVYPGIAQQTVFYNMPAVYKFVWKFMKPFVAKETLDGLTITHNLRGLLNMVDMDQLPRYLGGGSNHVFEWIPPNKSDDQNMNNEQLLLERLSILQELEAATRQWIESDVGHSRRREIVSKLKQNYELADIYMRHRTVYDRNGIVRQFEKQGPTASSPQSEPDSLGQASMISVDSAPSSIATVGEKPRRHISTFAKA